MAVAALLSAVRELASKYIWPRQPVSQLCEPGAICASQDKTQPAPASQTSTSLASWAVWLLSWLRATTAAMRSEALIELFRNGFSFISERLLSHASTDENPLETTSQIALTVDRIKPPLPSSSDSSPSSSAPLSSLFRNPDYETVWRDDVHEYITPAGFEAVASLLRAWGDDIAAENISRCRESGPIAGRFDGGSRGETRLSVVIHNLMLDLYGYNTEQAWQETVAELLKDLEAASTWIEVFYAPENLEAMKIEGVVPYGQLSASVQQYWGHGCGLCELAGFFSFSILQTDQWGHPGMHLSQVSMMKMLVDLESLHHHRPILSFVRIEKEGRPPGHLYDDGGAVLEAVTAKQLHDVWRYRIDASTSSEQARPRQPCCLHASGGVERLSEAAIRRARMVSAAAASIKAARRCTDGSRPMRVAPSQSLLAARYRRTSGSSSISAHDGPTVRKTYPIPAKRKAVTASADPRHFKRGRVIKELAAEIERDRAAEVAAAAAIPLPPSPAATELSFEEGEEKGEAVDVDVEDGERHRLPWESMFPLDEEDGPRLKISKSKAEELRLIAEQKRAALLEARRKREEEQRRKEELRRRKEEEERLARSGLRPPTRPVIPPLSESWYARVNATVRADPRREVARSPEGTALKSSDFCTVVSKSEWLNDEIVNGFLLHLANYINAKAGIMNVKTQTPRCHAFTSFFWKSLSTKGAAGTERWMKRVGVTRDNFLSIETILIPICERNHWTLVVVRPRQATVTHMDSMGSVAGRRPVLDIVMCWVRDFLQDRHSDRWRMQPLVSPRQTNGWDCGVHTVTNALFVALGLDPSFYGAKEMPLQRDRIAATLINGGFFGDLDLAGL
ncbi:ulp1 protease family protein [Grosmannia clavigera kw1407]|uniref:Ulp1 protease family protein n=1 Tax=Grosmannia clavigera (strain kw1407 / UAMH 11150) TaxID=655863 RepID=F0XTE2_GROCL|nr:ulp1 protease family protein [Grosmannia clavigera kw1407]EFW99015.1 ulp1 protease family protein [Grosmannia clavigera kw1407]